MWTYWDPWAKRAGCMTIAKAMHVNNATLVFNAAAEILSGQIATVRFHELAHSGGSRGHKATCAEKAKRYLHASWRNESLGRLAATPEIYDQKTDTYQQRGGTIPPGHYRCTYVANRSVLHDCIFLDPGRDAHAIFPPFACHAIVHHRGGFYIHGHGPKCSDGCIVLANELRRRALNWASRKFPGKVILCGTTVSYMLPAELEPSKSDITT